MRTIVMLDEQGGKANNSICSKNAVLFFISYRKCIFISFSFVISLSRILFEVSFMNEKPQFSVFFCSFILLFLIFLLFHKINKYRISKRTFNIIEIIQSYTNKRDFDWSNNLECISSKSNNIFMQIALNFLPASFSMDKSSLIFRIFG